MQCLCKHGNFDAVICLSTGECHLLSHNLTKVSTPEIYYQTSQNIHTHIPSILMFFVVLFQAQKDKSASEIFQAKAGMIAVRLFVASESVDCGTFSGCVFTMKVVFQCHICELDRISFTYSNTTWTLNRVNLKYLALVLAQELGIYLG